MPAQRRLTEQEWSIARRRWEGCPADGFDWLAREMQAAFDVAITRQAAAAMAKRKQWTKGGMPSVPLAVVPQVGDIVLRPDSGVAQHGNIAHPVALTEGAKPDGYSGTGRPAKYRPEYDQQIIEFFDVEATREVEVQGPAGTTKIQIVANKPPTLVSFAQGIGVSVDTVNRWATETDDGGRPRYPGFAEAYARAKQLLEDMLLTGAIMGVYEPKVTQFTLKNWYGWKDQPDKDVAVAPVSVELLDTLYIQRMAAARERQRLVLEERARLRLEEESGG
jgi:hypothetical protein